LAASVVIHKLVASMYRLGKAIMLAFGVFMVAQTLCFHNVRNLLRRILMAHAAIVFIIYVREELSSL
jgi:hypothetical protein